MKFWTKIGDWLYFITTPIDVVIFKPIRIIFKEIADRILSIEEFVKNLVVAVLVILVVILILFAIYWIGKALLGFIKYYSQFA